MVYYSTHSDNFFVVPDFVWKTKKAKYKTPEYKVLPHFSIGRKKKNVSKQGRIKGWGRGADAFFFKDSTPSTIFQYPFSKGALGANIYKP